MLFNNSNHPNTFKNYQIAPPPQNFKRTNSDAVNNDIFSSLNEIFMQEKPFNEITAKNQVNKSEDLFDDEFDPRADEKKIKENKSSLFFYLKSVTFEDGDETFGDKHLKLFFYFMHILIFKIYILAHNKFNLGFIFFWHLSLILGFKDKIFFKLYTIATRYIV